MKNKTWGQMIADAQRSADRAVAALAQAEKEDTAPERLLRLRVNRRNAVDALRGTRARVLELGLDPDTVR